MMTDKEKQLHDLVIDISNIWMKLNKDSGNTDCLKHVIVRVGKIIGLAFANVCWDNDSSAFETPYEDWIRDGIKESLVIKQDDDNEKSMYEDIYLKQYSGIKTNRRVNYDG